MAIATVRFSCTTGEGRHGHMLKNGTRHQDLGANHFDKRAQGKHVLQLVNRLKNFGFAVQITPMAA
jgi:transposase